MIQRVCIATAERMIFRSLLLVVISILWHWRTGRGTGTNTTLLTLAWNVSVASQSQLDQFIENVTAHNGERNTSYFRLSLVSENAYVLDIVRLMNINLIDGGSLIIESNGGTVEIDCTASHSDLEELREVLQPISRASLVLMDGLVMTGCPVPIMIEEASNVTIQNCIFQHHEHGAVNIFNSANITVENCTFHNNTSDGYFSKPYQGSAGGLSIGHNSSDNYFTRESCYYERSDPLLLNMVHIINCTFTNNSALFLDGQEINPSEALQNHVFFGRGGALFVYPYIKNPLSFVFNDNKVINNFANAYGGGVYCVTPRSSSQNYTFSNNVFINNTGSAAGGLVLLYLDVSQELHFPINTLVYNCAFYSNTAKSQVAGAVAIYFTYEVASNINVTFIDCKFSNNTAVAYGGAVDITSYIDFFDNIETILLVKFINCMFDGNMATDGAAMNLISYGAIFYNVTFKSNRGSAVRMIGCAVQFKGEVNFIENEAKDGGALYIISFGQMKVFPDTTITFERNKGKIGASIVVLTKRFSRAKIFNQLLYNPLCFLLHQYLHTPFSYINNFQLTFTNNSASEAAAIWMHTAQQCSWIGFFPPYFDPASILHWEFLSNRSLTQVRTSISHINVLNGDVGKIWPGKPFVLAMEMIDELNRSASGFMQLDAVNESNQSAIRYKVQPSVVYHYSSRPLNVTIVVDTNDRTYYGTNVTIVVKEFMSNRARNISSNFTLKVVSCPGEYELTYNASLNGYICQFYIGNMDIGTCEEDHSILLLTDQQWGLNQCYTEQPENLTVYPCPPGYCRCFHDLCNVGDEICSYAYFNDDPDKQCNCYREGYLCGDCKDSKGVTTLLNHCVDCSDINILLLAALLIVDTTLIILMLCKEVRFPSLLFPTIFFINMVSYVGENYPTSYDQVGNYVYFINSLLSLYFPYDFCLYSGATPLAMYTFRYFPIFLTIIICSIGLTLHQNMCKKIKRFSWNNLWLLLTLQYSHVVYTSMTILYCPQVINMDGEHQYRWFVKGSLECFTDYHIPLGLCAVFVLVICVLIIPFLGLVAVRKLKRPYWMCQLMKCLKHPFKENLPWWCMIELGRKLVFLLLLIPFPQNTAPPMCILMVTFTVYAYVLPYKEMFVNIIELFFQLCLLIFLMLRSTRNIVDEYLIFPNHKYSDDMEIENCSSETGTAYLTWTLLPFAYLPLAVIIVIFSVKILLRFCYQCCVQCNHVNTHHDYLREASASCHVNVSHTKYFLLGFQNDSINLVDAAAADDDS